ncbi:hypothetical protein C476_07248, partial [Natrinema limicola JCM 13563]
FLDRPCIRDRFLPTDANLVHGFWGIRSTTAPILYIDMQYNLYDVGFSHVAFTTRLESTTVEFDQKNVYRTRFCPRFEPV